MRAAETVDPHPNAQRQMSLESLSRSREISDAELVWAEIERLNLEPHIVELEAKGFTVVPPEKATTPEFVDRCRTKILEVAERRHGARPNLETGGTHERPEIPFGQLLFYMLFEDPVFQEAVLNPVGLALTHYLLGRSAVLSNCIAGIKGPGGEDLNLHADNVMIPPPFPSYAQVCNVTLLLTDYDKEAGALCHVPNSHRLCRHPYPGEALGERVPIIAPAGSIVFWHGNTWHGAFARTKRGLRINLIMAMMRSYMRPQERYREDVTQEILDRNPPQFATLMGKHIDYGWREEGHDFGVTYPGRTLWD